MAREYLTIRDANIFFDWSDEQLEHMVEVVKEHGISVDGPSYYVTRETILDFSLEFVLDCVLEQLKKDDPLAGIMYEKIAKHQRAIGA